MGQFDFKLGRRSDDSSGVLPPKSATSQQAGGGDSPEFGALSGYQVVGKLGAGGMGTVWRAIQLSTRRQIALKILNAGELGSDFAKQRFLREIELVSLLEHPGIARIYDSGAYQGAYFYAMELVEGVALDEHIREQKLNQRQSLALMRTVCQAIEYAHQKGVIHRDLKPSNILVDQEGKPRIVDFGLGKLLGEQISAVAITVSGQWAGTPAYMSPEQAAGKPDQIDHRSDIYSLGVILYQVVTGRLPFDSDGGQLAILQRVVHDDAVRPRKTGARVDRDLEAVILKATAKNPRLRYSSAAALADDIDRYLAGSPLTARRPTVGYFLQKRAARHRWSIGMVSSFAAVLMAVSLGYSIRIARERDLADAAASAAKSLQQTSEVGRADSLILSADGLALDGKWPQAADDYSEARAIRLQQRISCIDADLGLLEAYRHAPDALSEFVGANLPLEPVGVAFDSDNRLIRAVLPSGIVRSYDPVTGGSLRVIGSPIGDGQVMAEFEALTPNVIYRLVLRHDSHGSAKSDVERMDLATGAVKTEITFNGAFGSHAVVSPNGDYAVGAGRLNTVDDHREWNLWLIKSGGQAPICLMQHGEKLRAIAISPDRSVVATGDVEGRLKFWNVATGDEIHPATLESGPTAAPSFQSITALKYAPDGRGILVGETNGNISFLSFAGAPVVKKFASLGTEIRDFAFAPDGQSVVSADTGANLCLWDVQSGELRRVYCATASVVAVAFSSDGHLVAASTIDGTICVWNVDLADQSTLCRCSAPVNCLAVAPDSLLAAIGMARQVRVIDVPTGETLWKFNLPKEASAIRFLPADTGLDIAMTSGEVRRYELFGQWRQIGGCPAATVFAGLPAAAPSDRMNSVYLPSNSDRALCMTRSNAIILDVKSGSRQRTFTGSFRRIGAISPDGRKAIAIDLSSGPEMKIFDLESGSISKAPLDRLAPVIAATIAPNSKTAFIAYADTTLQAIDLENGKTVWTQSSSQRTVSLVVSSDGSALLSGGDDGSLRVMRAADGHELRRLAGGLDPVWATAISSRDDLILSDGASGNGIIEWDLSIAARFREFAHTRRGERPSGVGISRLGEWYRLQGKYDWANEVMGESKGDATTGLTAARSRWQAGDFAGASAAFKALERLPGPDGMPHGYIQACADAAASGP